MLILKIFVRITNECIWSWAFLWWETYHQLIDFFIVNLALWIIRILINLMASYYMFNIKYMTFNEINYLAYQIVIQ